MRWKFVVVFCILTFGIFASWFIRKSRTSEIISPIAEFLEKPLDKYTIDRLSRRGHEGSQIVFDEAIATTSGFTAYRFHFTSEGKKVTGLAHVPSSAVLASDTGQSAEALAKEENQRIKLYPVIVQFRGYVDREIYTPGEGTRRSAEVFAKNGFISLAPDFLGYGGSDAPSSDIFEERFQTYTTALDLLGSIDTLAKADKTRVGIWGHSNGGQIALTVLEAVGKPYPTTLWAPVSKPFPYSILYYTDEALDRGKLLRKRLAKFEDEYNVDEYSMVNYLHRIKAKLLLHQGTQDRAVPQAWSDEIVQLLKDQKVNVTYYVYSNADHNMSGAWNIVVTRDIQFFERELRMK